MLGFFLDERVGNSSVACVIGSGVRLVDGQRKCGDNRVGEVVLFEIRTPEGCAFDVEQAAVE